MSTPDDPNKTVDANPAPADPTSVHSWVGGRYQLYGEIARGGMGAVLRGRDVELGRDLAVKVLLEKHADRPEVARRFVEEAQIAGQLQHPGVVPVYDIGRFGDRPFFTMKLVKGKTLAAMLGDRAGASSERPRLLAIVLQVAQTMAYAHAKGVIHRDLKPANVMVGAFGEVQVMDWGLAKVLGEGGVADEERPARPPEAGTEIRTARGSGSGSDTEAGSMLGTPAYMPPEQANGDVAHLDRRADVFGLGAILCEVLTGEPPYVGRSREEVRRRAANGDLADALARLDSCGADPELIALIKGCLSPEAIDRPGNAQAVADRLAAHLDGVQDRLRRAELAEAEARAKAAEGAKRLRLTVALAGTVLLAVALGGGGWLGVKADRDARVALLTREVNEALTRATALRERSKTEPAGGALLAQAREQAQRALALVESGPIEAALREEVRLLQTQLDEEEKDRTLIAALEEARLAQADSTIGETRFASERSLSMIRAAFRAYGLPAGESEPEAVADRIRRGPTAVREAIVAALDEWVFLAGLKSPEAAEPHHEWLRAVLEAVEPEDAWGRRVWLARRLGDQQKRRAALVTLAKSADVTKLPARALSQIARSLEPPQAVGLLQRVQQQYPGDFWVNHDLGVSLLKLIPPEYDQAVRYLTAAVALRPNSSGCHYNLGNALHKKGRLDEAIASYRRAIDLDPNYVSAHTNLGVALWAVGWPDEAIVSCRKAIGLDPNFGMAHSNLGAVLYDMGRLDEAIVSFRRAIELNTKDAKAHSNLGIALRNTGRLDEAILSHRRAIELDPKNAIAHSNLGGSLHAKGRLDEATVSYRRAIELDPKNAIAHDNLGQTLGKTGRLDEAILSHRRAIELDPKFAMAYTNLGLSLRGQGQYSESLASLRRGHELGMKQAGWHHQSAEWVRQAERLASLEDNLPALLKGNNWPSDATQRLLLLEICTTKKLHAASSGLYAEALAADPKFADDPTTDHRYNAACHAALAAAGRGEDAAKLSGNDRLALRRQALTWLRADLAARHRQIEYGSPAERSAAQQALRHWQQDADLAALRDAAELAKLPADERRACEKLWADVAALLR